MNVAEFAAKNLQMADFADQAMSGIMFSPAALSDTSIQSLLESESGDFRERVIRKQRGRFRRPKVLPPGAVYRWVREVGPETEALYLTYAATSQTQIGGVFATDEPIEHWSFGAREYGRFLRKSDTMCDSHGAAVASRDGIDFFANITGDRFLDLSDSDFFSPNSKLPLERIANSIARHRTLPQGLPISHVIARIAYAELASRMVNDHPNVIGFVDDFFVHEDSILAAGIEATRFDKSTRAFFPTSPKNGVDPAHNRHLRAEGLFLTETTRPYLRGAREPDGIPQAQSSRYQNESVESIEAHFDAEGFARDMLPQIRLGLPESLVRAIVKLASRYAPDALRIIAPELLKKEPALFDAMLSASNPDDRDLYCQIRLRSRDFHRGEVEPYLSAFQKGSQRIATTIARRISLQSLESSAELRVALARTEVEECIVISASALSHRPHTDEALVQLSACAQLGNAAFKSCKLKLENFDRAFGALADRSWLATA